MTAGWYHRGKHCGQFCVMDLLECGMLRLMCFQQIDKFVYSLFDGSMAVLLSYRFLDNSPNG